MNLEVYICPDQDRIDGIYKSPLNPHMAADLWKGKNKPIPDRFIVTCYKDVVKWGEANKYRMDPGMHWYCINVGTPDGELMYFEMPRGDMMAENRIWKIIELYAAFYHEIP